MDTIALGGVYLHTLTPLAKDATTELILRLPAGKVRIRAVVRRSLPGRGMALEFVQMAPEDRARLNQFLSQQDAARKASSVPPASHSQSASTTDAVVGLPTGEVCVRAIVLRSLQGRDMGLEFLQMAPEDRARLNQFLSQQDATRTASSVPPASHSQSAASVAEGLTDPLLFERELKQMLEAAGKGTYYQLLAVTPESPHEEIKKSYYAIARKFHPDGHMDKIEFIGPLKELMVLVTVAYDTLMDGEKRTSYDRVLAASGAFNLQREKTEAQETIEECLNRANECLRAGNFVGSIVWLRKCAHKAPDTAKYHALLARSLATVVAYRDESIEHFRKAIDLDPWDTTAYFQFGELYEKMGLPWRARPLYSKVLEINPVHTKALERLEQLDSEEKSTESPSLLSRVFGKKD